MEGGARNDSAASKAALRQAMNEFLREVREAARAKTLGWEVVPCGSRDATFKAFRQARSPNDRAVIVLLVDAENPVNPTSPRHHLMTRDKWDLAGIPDKECTPDASIHGDLDRCGS